MRITKLAQVAVLLFVTMLGASASAQSASATAYVEKQQGHITSLLKKSASPAEVSNAMAAIVDYDEMTRRAFGKYWGSLSTDANENAARQVEVEGLLRQLIENNYKKNLKKTLGYDTDFKDGTTSPSEPRVKVKATKGSGHEAKIYHLEYVLRPDGDGYKAVDLITEGSSMTKNYYTQFDTMLSDPAKGYGFLVNKLRDAVARSAK